MRVPSSSPPPTYFLPAAPEHPFITDYNNVIGASDLKTPTTNNGKNRSSYVINSSVGNYASASGAGDSYGGGGGGPQRGNGYNAPSQPYHPYRR